MLPSLSAVAVCAAGAWAQVINGGFEQPGLGFRSVLPGQTYGNWTSAGPDDIEFVHATLDPGLPNLHRSACEGQYRVDLCGVGRVSAIYQDILGLPSGQPCRVDFACSGNVWGPNFNFVRDVVWNGSVVGTFEVVRGGNKGALMNWELKHVDVVAGSGPNRLMFRGVTAVAARGPAIDAVSITPIPAPAGVGLAPAGLIGATRRRRHA